MRGSPARGQARGWVLGCGLVAWCVGALVAMPAAGAATGRAFSGVASSSGSRVTYAVPGYLLIDTLVDGGSATTQALLESAGAARSFASAPYPGDLVVTAPGTVAGFGGPSGIPPYPAYAAADYPTAPESHFGDQGASLDAKASDASATARVQLGANAKPNELGTTDATSAVTKAADGTITAEAVSVTNGLAFGDGVLTIASVEAHATSVLRPGDAAPKTTHEIHVNGAKVAGQDVTIGKQGPELTGNTLPGPGVDPVRAALATAGVAVSFDDSRDVSGGAWSGGLRIDVTRELPVPGNPKGVASYRIGEVMTAIRTGTDVASATPLPVESGGSTTPEVSGSVLSADRSPSTAPAATAAPGAARAPEMALLAVNISRRFRLLYIVFVGAATLLAGLRFAWRSTGRTSRAG